MLAGLGGGSWKAGERRDRGKKSGVRSIIKFRRKASKREGKGGGEDSSIRMEKRRGHQIKKKGRRIN